MYHNGKQCVNGDPPSCAIGKEYYAGKCVVSCNMGLKRVNNKCVQDNTYECPEGTINNAKKGCVNSNGSSYIPQFNFLGGLPPLPPGIVPNPFPLGPDGNVLNPDLGAQVQSFGTNLDNFENITLDEEPPVDA